MKSRYSIILFLLVIVNLFFLYRCLPKEGDFAKYADEGYYFNYTKYISENGVRSYPKLFKNHIEDKKNWIYPSPLRAGYFLVTTFLFKTFGASYSILAKFSLFCYVLFLLVCFYFAKKSFGDELAALFLLLLSFSPLSMAMAKRILTDGPANLFVAISIWLFLIFLADKKTWSFILFIIFYTYSILIKEQSIFLICFFSIFFLIYKYIYKENIRNIYLPLIWWTPLLIAGAVWLIFIQNLSSIIAMFKILRAMPAVNEYSIALGRGPWFRYIIDYTLISPLVTVLSLSFIVYVFIKREFLKNYKIGYFVTLFIWLFLSLSMFDYAKNVRYTLALDMVMRLFVVFILKELFKESKFAAGFCFLGVLFLCFLDHLSFVRLFYQYNIYDPMTFMLLKARQLIP